MSRAGWWGGDVCELGDEFGNGKGEMGGKSMEMGRFLRGCFRGWGKRGMCGGIFWLGGDGVGVSGGLRVGGGGGGGRGGRLG